MSRKRIDLTGQRFGKLTVLEPAEDAGGKTVWCCRCDCGRETVVRAGNLRNGHTKSCGCQRGPKSIDLTGQRFGRLVVLEPTENIGSNAAWRCRCDCGKEVVVLGGNLCNGNTQSCGCQRGRKSIDLAGRRFGKLTVLEPAGNIGKEAAWRCRCDCGKETVVRGGNLRSGNAKSCGCQRGTKRIDLTGQKFGRWTVLGPAENTDLRYAWRCRCDCGKEAVVRSGSLRSGGTKSCGCLLTFNRPQITLVDGTCVENIRPKKLNANNTSGVRGVSWSASTNHWKAYIGFKGKNYHLGSFAKFDDAVAARKKAEAEMYDTFLEEYDAAQAEEKELVGCQNVST